jgi:hypothetical protein
MTNYLALMGIYHQLDTVYMGVILIVVWIAVFGHILDQLTPPRIRLVIPIYWGMALSFYVAAIIFIGTTLSN